MADTTIKSNNTCINDMQKKSLQRAIYTLRGLHHDTEACALILGSVEHMLSTCNGDSSKYLLERVKWVKAQATKKPKGFWTIIDMLSAEIESFINS